MRDFKDEQIVFYCNCCGELHRDGKDEIQKVEDLPLPLQSVYETYWTDNLTLPCYISYVDGRPGLLLAAEYDEDTCKIEKLPLDRGAKYTALSERCKRMELLVKTVSETAEVGIGVDTGFDLEMMLFIPTQDASGQEILRLYYLMDEFAFSAPPDKVDWGECGYQLLALINRCLAPSDVRARLLTQLTTAAEDTAGESVSYMGLTVPRNSLPSMSNVIAGFERDGSYDHTLDCCRSVFQNCFGRQLIWTYPLSDDMRGGGTIVPVQEGFLYLPYAGSHRDAGTQYNPSEAELLTAESAGVLRKEYHAYSEGLCSALDDMIRYLDVPATDYTDDEGNLYFVRTGIGGVYKAFRRYAAPKKGQRRESGLHAVPYRKSREQAQRDLDEYAKQHGLKAHAPSQGGSAR